MTQAEANEIRRLNRKHHDIRRLGAGVTELVEARDAKQAGMAAFVLEHGISCFKCQSGMNDWASTGTTNRRAWAICVRCVRLKGGS